MRADGNEPLARHALAFVLAGGRGSRLMELTDRRAKPAVYFGGKSRIIDFALSNAMNSGIRRIAVATIDYRPDDALPGEIFDVKAYVRFFRAKAKEYNIDPQRIAVWGTSRGGHLGALASADLAARVREGCLDPAGRAASRRVRKQRLTALSSSRWALSLSRWAWSLSRWA